MKKKILMAFGLAFLTVITVFLSNAGATTTVYSNDFDTAYVAPGISATLDGGDIGTATGSYGGSNGKYWSNSYFNGNGTSATLTLSNLPAHTDVSIDLLLGFLNSWDSRNGTVTPDNLDIYIDGSLFLNMTTNNASGTIVDFDGGTLLVNNGQIDGSQYYSDDLVDMATASALTLAHTASTLTVTITPSGSGWQNWTDEGWGMDALSVSLSPVPVPSALLLLASGLLGLAGVRRKKTA